MAQKGTTLVKPDDTDQFMRQHAGMGISTDAADNLVSGISVLQPLSPKVTAGEAAAGDFLLPDQIISGKKGLWFQPCATDDLWIEFTPRERGGGFVKSHPFNGYNSNQDAIPPEGSHRNGFAHLTPDGNDLAHYSQWYGILWDETGQGREHVINFKKSGHTVRKK